jgi:hypothetical protein
MRGKLKQRKYLWPTYIDHICYSESPVQKFTYLHDTDFPHPSRTVFLSTQPPVKRRPGLFLGGKAAEAWRWPPTPSSSEVKERVYLHLYTLSGSIWPILGWNVTLPVILIRRLPFPFKEFNFFIHWSSCNCDIICGVLG